MLITLNREQKQFFSPAESDGAGAVADEEKSPEFEKARAALDEMLAEDDASDSTGDSPDETSPDEGATDSGEVDSDSGDGVSEVEDDETDSNVSDGESGSADTGNEIPEELVRLAGSYGIPSAELKGRSEAEIRFAIQVIDKQVRTHGQLQVDRLKPRRDGDPSTGTADQAEGQDEGRQGSSQAASQEQSSDSSKPAVPMTEAEIAEQVRKFRDSGFEDEVVEVLESQLRSVAAQAAENARLRDDVGKIREVLTGAQTEAQRRAAEAARQRNLQDTQEFLSFVDGLGEPELFGSADSELTAEQKENIGRLFNETMVRRAGMATLGMSPALNQQVVDQVFRQSFADRVKDREEKERSRKLVKQSKRVMGRGTPATGRADVPFDGSPEDDPVIRQWAEEHGLHA